MKRHLAAASLSLAVLLGTTALAGAQPRGGTVIDANVDRHNTRKQATAYLEYLYTPEGQDIIGKNFYRPIDPAAKAKYASQFKNVKLTTIADFGGWEKAQKTYFADRGVFDQIIKSLRK